MAVKNATIFVCYVNIVVLLTAISIRTAMDFRVP